MNKSGKVLQVSIDVPVQKKDGGTYPGWQLVFMSNGKAETIQKHMNSLKFAPTIRAALELLVPGDDVTVEMEKKGDFWEVVSIAKGMNIPVSTNDPKEGSSKPTWKSDKTNTYETPEERATRREIDVKRQRLIVRQSSIDQARQIAGTDAKLPAIFKLAKQIEEYVYEGVSFPNDVTSTEPEVVS